MNDTAVSLSEPTCWSPDNEMSWRQLMGAVLVLVIAATGCFHRLTLHPTSLLVGPQRGGENDVTLYFLARHHSVARHVADEGSPPVWNSAAFAGHPVLGNPQSAMFYPPNWLFWWLPATNTISWIMVAHHVWGGLGAFATCRAFGWRWLASILAGLIYQAAPFYVAQLSEGHYNQVCVASWLPWILWGYERVRANSWRNLWRLVAVLSAAFFAGHVQEVYYMVLILTGFWVWDLGSAGFHLVNGRTLTPGTPSRIAAWPVALLLVLGGTAVELLPIFAFVTQSLRSTGIDAQRAGGLQWSNLWQLWNPFALGGPETSTPPRFYWETVCYFGIVPMLLAVAAVLRTAAASIFAGERNLYPVPRIAFAGLAAFSFAFGANNPLFPWLYRLVPGMSNFREPGRILFFVSLCVAILAAAAAEQFLRRRDDNGANSEVSAVRKRNSAPWVFAVGLLCVVELGSHATAVLRSLPAENLRRENPIVIYFQTHLGSQRVLAPQRLISDGEAWSHGLQNAACYEPVPLADYFAVFQSLANVDQGTRNQILMGFADVPLAAIQLEIANLLGIRYLVSQPQPVPDGSTWRLAARGTVSSPVQLLNQKPREFLYQIFENPHALPRAFVVGHAKLFDARTNSAHDALLATDFRRQVLLEQNDVLPDGERAEFHAAKIVDTSSRRMVMEAELTAPGYLVVTDMFVPGWHARANGQSVPVLAANIAFRAVPLPAGKHVVEFEYQPPGLKLGALITVVSVGVLLVLRVFSKDQFSSHRQRGHGALNQNQTRSQFSSINGSLFPKDLP